MFEGLYMLQIDWLVVFDGVCFGICMMLDLKFEGVFYEGCFVIVDICIDLFLFIECLVFFDFEWNFGNIIFMYCELYGIWCVDYQLLFGEDFEVVLKFELFKVCIDV